MNHHASMNRIYRLIWSEVRRPWVPVAETARGRGKSGRARSTASRNLVAAAISLALAPLAHAAPPLGHPAARAPAQPRTLVPAAISLALAPLAHAAPPLGHAAAPPAHATSPCAAPVCGPTALSATGHPLGGKVGSGSARIT